MKLTLILLISASISAYSQGCSDAGICSLPEHKQANERVYMIGIEQGFGLVNNYSYIFNTNFEFYLDLNENITISGFIPYIFNSGEVDYLSGVGDPIFVISYIKQIWEKEFEFDIGARLPLGEDNNQISNTNFGLPMFSQQGLGTFDFLARIGFSLEQLDFLAGVQIPLSGANDNTFGTEAREVLKTRLEKLEEFELEESLNLNRSMDIISRIRYKIFHADNFGLKVGLLGLFAPFKSEITTHENSVIEVDGSDGLVLNAILGIDIELNEKILISFEIGSPFIKREAEPSGLARLVQSNFGLFYSL